MSVERQLNSIKGELRALRRLETKLVSEIKKGKTELKEVLEYVRSRKIELMYREAKLIVAAKRT